MGKIPPLYGNSIDFWAKELLHSIKKNDEPSIQVCLKALAQFIKNELKD